MKRDDPEGDAMRFDPDATTEDAEVEAGLSEGSPSAEQAPTPPAGRYGRTPGPQHRTRVAIAIGTAAVLGTALIVWLGLANASSPVTWKEVGFEVQSPERVEITFNVAMKPGTTAVCTLDALAESYAQVGTVDVTVGPSEQRESPYTAVIATSELATTAVVSTCTAN